MKEKNIKYDSLVKFVRSIEEENVVFIMFLKACENGDFEICQLFLDAGISINICTSNKFNLLHKLIIEKKFTVEMADWLISKGIDINAKSDTGYTSLTIACARKNFEIAKYLIDKGAKIQNYDEAEKRADIIVAGNQGSYQIVELIINSGITIKKEIGEDLLNYIVKTTGYNRKDEIKIIKLLLDNGISPNFYNNANCSVLHEAVLKGDKEIAQLLLNNKADVNAKLKKGCIYIVEYNIALTPMDIAIAKNNVEMQKILLSFGGKTSTKTEKIEALTEFKDREDFADIIKRLLESET